MRVARRAASVGVVWSALSVVVGIVAGRAMRASGTTRPEDLDAALDAHAA